MEKSTQITGKKNKLSLFGYGLKQRGLVFLINFGVIGVFFIIGRFIDHVSQQSPLWTFAFVIFSFPITQFLLYKILTRK